MEVHSYSFVRHQRLVALRRIADQKFWCGPASSPRWTRDLRMVNLAKPHKLRRVIEIDFGLPLERFELVPVKLAGVASPVPTGEDWGDVAPAPQSRKQRI